MIIKNAKVYREEGIFEKTDILIDKGEFSDWTSDESIVDAEGCFAVPGLTDIHFHGCAGYDFCDGTLEALEVIAQYQASAGVTTIVPATMTLDEERLIKICETAAVYNRQQKNAAKRAVFCGINMEGPFISLSKKGAQNAAYVRRPDKELFDRMQKASGGCIKLVAVAPEVDGAMEFIAAKKDETILSVAHTAGGYQTTVKALEQGATHLTHLFNAMTPFTHREPGPIGACADDARCNAELICDGVHVHPSAVRAAFKLFGAERIILISDSMMAAGLPDGSYSLGAQTVQVNGNKAQLRDGTIAGSVTNLMECLQNAVLNMGIPLETAVKCAAVNPAKCVGIYNKYGSISRGKVANMVLLRESDLSIDKVILKGEIV